MEKEAVELLKKLGFTEYEAKVIYALLRLREAEVSSISKVSGVPRTKIYDILRDLRRRGYIIEIDSKPIRFSITDPERFVDMLIETKKRELERIEKEADTLKHLIMVESEIKSEKTNYIMKLRNPSDLFSLIDTSSVVQAGSTITSMELFKKYLRKVIISPVDFILTRDALYVALEPLGKKRKEYVIVVFSDPRIVKEAIKLFPEQYRRD